MRRLPRHLLSQVAPRPDARASIAPAAASIRLPSHAAKDIVEAKAWLAYHQQRQASTSYATQDGPSSRQDVQSRLQGGMRDILGSSPMTGHRLAPPGEDGQKFHTRTPVADAGHDEASSLWSRLELEPNLAKNQQKRVHHLPGYARMMNRIRKGNVVAAMTIFTSAAMPESRGTAALGQQLCAHRPNPHTVDTMIQKLSALAIVPPGHFRGHQQVLDHEDGHIWMPPQIGSDRPERRDILTMQPQVLAVYALASVYDVATIHRLLPSNASTARMLRAFAAHLQRNTFESVMKLTLLAMCEVSLYEAQVLAERSIDDVVEHLVPGKITLQVLVAAIDTLGGFGQRAKAEHLLHWWMADKCESEVTDNLYVSARLSEEHRRTLLLSIPLSAWPASSELYSALIRACATVNDISGSRAWLMRYRNIMALRQDYGGKTTIETEPYLGHLLGIAKVPSTSFHPQKAASPAELGMHLRREAVSDLVNLLMQDGIPLNEGIFSVILNFHVGIDQLAEAVEMLQTLSRPSEMQKMSASVYKALFDLDHRWTNLHRNALDRPFTGEHAMFNSARELVCQLLYRLGSNARKPWKLEHSLETMNAALGASLARGDLPLALAVILALERLEAAQCDRDTWETVMKGVARLRRTLKHDESSSATQSVLTSSRNDDPRQQEAEHLIKESLIARGLASTAQSDSALPSSSELQDVAQNRCSELPFWSDGLDTAARLSILRGVLSREIVQIVKHGPLGSEDPRADAPSWAQDVHGKLKLSRVLVEVEDSSVVQCALKAFLIDEATGRLRARLLSDAIEA